MTLMGFGAGPGKLEAQDAIRFAAPFNFRISAPIKGTGTTYNYTLEAQWDYYKIQVGAAPATWKFVVDWDGTEVDTSHDLADSRDFTEPGPIDVRVRFSAACTLNAGSCYITVDGLVHIILNGKEWVSTWSETQTVLLPVADDQYPTNVTESEAPPAIVDALGAVFGAIGVQDPDAKAHLWSIFICLLLAIGLAAICVGSTGGGPASVFLGAVAFFLVFSLAGPPAFGVPGVFAGLALLVPSLGLVVFAKTKVR